MNKNTSKIRALIRELANKPEEIISGTVVPGSIDTEELTISVQPTGSNEIIPCVLLNAIATNGTGMILFPKENSDVVIGSIDSPGEWCLIRASEITKAQITIDQVVFKMDASKVTIQNGDVIFDISNQVFKLKTPNESLFQLLHDCFSYLAALTVPTPSGTSGVPVNVTDFANLQTRLNNLLNA